MTLVILAAGLGSRYGGLKQLDPMTDAGNFIIDFSVYDAIQAGFDKVVFIIKEDNLALFKETIGNRIATKIDVTYVFQRGEDLPDGFALPAGRTKPWGTGHALYCVREIVKENFAIINADDFYGRDSFMLLAKHLKTAQPSDGKAHHCMVGYLLGNTVTENGHFSRGQCDVTADGMLQRVTERTKIVKKETCAAYLEEDGVTWTDLPFDTVVSMNCWGFTPDIFNHLEASFVDFLSNLGDDPLKAEFYLPTVVNLQQQAGRCDVRVYPTTAIWYGVTYPEDKEKVKNAIQTMISDGEYPADLWN